MTGGRQAACHSIKKAGCCMILPERISSYIGIALTILLIVSDKNILMGFKKKTFEV